MDRVSVTAAQAEGVFTVPVVLLLFLRKDAALRIVERLRQVRPATVYLVSDHGRTEAEKLTVAEVRTAVERAIDWECTVVRHYADRNLGVYANIALGAKWVFEREARAIFLEDDNIPEVSFFEFCRELLDRYESDSRVFWICGTNYLGDCEDPTAPSYSFTHHLLPCGWASWSTKFLTYYDFDLTLADDKAVMKDLPHRYRDRALYRQQLGNVVAERARRDAGERYRSWDHHLGLTLRAHGLLGAMPARNQVLNVGADGLSTHGGNSVRDVMTRRFTGMNSFPMVFPLRHPSVVAVDPAAEARVGAIIRHPLTLRVRGQLRRLLGAVLRLDPLRPAGSQIRARLGLR